jgi:hypothetical protein
MTTVTDEELMAYVDGELDAARFESLRQEIAASVDLTRRVADQQALRNRLRQAFDPTLDEAVPARLTDVTSRDSAIQFASAARRRPARSAWLGGLALAAGIVLGVAIAPMLLELTREPQQIVASGARLAAGGALADNLSQRLASDQSAADSIRLGVSFLARSGEYCRTFVARRGDAAMAGMACRQGAVWRIDALQSVTIVPGASDGYRQAATALPPLVLQAVEAAMAGDPLDAAREAQARDHDWRPPAATR